jgi:hypothetical protein
VTLLSRQFQLPVTLGQAVVAKCGAASEEFDAQLVLLDADTSWALDAVRDAPDLLLPQKPERLRKDLRRLTELKRHQ